MDAKRKLFFLLPVVALLAAACLPQPTLYSELFLDDQSLLTGEPCEAPCWNGIIPGETIWDDAEVMIMEDSLFAGFESESDGEVIQGVWQRAETEQYCCRLIADEPDRVISYIFLAVAPNMIVDQVLERYGDPAYVTTFAFTDVERVVQLIYPDTPMVLSVLVGEGETSILANSPVVAMLYMTPEEMQFILDTTDLQAWVGYQQYDIYDQGTPVVTPIMTLTPLPEE